MRVAIIADIHSNWPALEAVWRDIQTQGVDEVIVAGDAVNGAPFPREVLALIYAEGWRMVKGNHEQYMLDCHDPTCDKYPPDLWRSFHWTLSQLSLDDLSFFQALPETLIIDNLIIMHASPHNLNWGILPCVPDSLAHRKFGHLSQKFIVTAHTHVPFVHHGAGKVFFNPGAVGMPFDGCNAASYMILTQRGQNWIYHNRRVAYDLDWLIHFAETSGFAASDVFARNGLVQMRNGQPQTHLLMRSIEELQIRHNLNLAEAMEQVDLTQIVPDGDYMWPYRLIKTDIS